MTKKNQSEKTNKTFHEFERLKYTDSETWDTQRITKPKYFYYKLLHFEPPYQEGVLYENPA